MLLVQRRICAVWHIDEYHLEIAPNLSSIVAKKSREFKVQSSEKSSMWACVLQGCEFRYKLPYKKNKFVPCNHISSGWSTAFVDQCCFASTASFAAVSICSHHGSRLVTVLFLRLWICSGLSFPRRNHSVETRGRSAVWRKSESIRTVQFQDFVTFAHAACCKIKLFLSLFWPGSQFFPTVL